MNNNRRRFKAVILSQLAFLVLGTSSLNSGVEVSLGENFETPSGSEVADSEVADLPCSTNFAPAFEKPAQAKLYSATYKITAATMKPIKVEAESSMVPRKGYLKSDGDASGDKALTWSYPSQGIIYPFKGQPGKYTFKVRAKGKGDLRLTLNGQRIDHRSISNPQYGVFVIKTRPLKRGDRIGLNFVSGQNLALDYLVLVPVGNSRSPLLGRGSVPWLRTEGKWVVNEKGQKVKLRGVSLCNYPSYAKRISEVTNGRNGWYANVVRIPVYPKAWKREGANKYFRKYIEPAVQQCIKEKIYCIIDWHEIREWDKGEHQQVLDFWNFMAPEYKDVSNIIYEVFNEPSRPTPHTLNNWLRWRKTAQPWVNLIRSHAPHNIILVGSPDWSKVVQFAQTYPFKGENLVYVYHTYPYVGTKEKMAYHISNGRGERVPIFVTEFGWQPNNHRNHGGRTSGWGQQINQFLDERPYINWTAWAYSPTCGPSMLDHNWKPKDGEHMGQFIKSWIDKENNK